LFILSCGVWGLENEYLYVSLTLHHTKTKPSLFP